MGKRAEFRLRIERQRRNTIITVTAGLGLILLSVVVLIGLTSSSVDPSVGSGSQSTIPVAVNYPAPELTLENIKGGTESLTDFRGKVVLVNNWATWCPPCKAEMPTLVAFYNDYAKDGLMIVAIEAGEPRDQVQIFADQYQMPFAVWLDPSGKSQEAFKNGSLPNSYVIDRTGTVRLMWIGQIDREVLEQYVTPLLVGN